jgi:hypothetical protein
VSRTISWLKKEARGSRKSDLNKEKNSLDSKEENAYHGVSDKVIDTVQEPSSPNLGCKGESKGFQGKKKSNR